MMILRTHARALRRLDHVARAVDVHTLVGLVADLPVDPRAVRDDLACVERRGERIDVARVDAVAP